MRLPNTALLSVAAALAIWLGCAAAGRCEAGSAVSTVLYVPLENHPITPVIARHLDRALEDAEASGAVCLVIALDTPGGLIESTREMVKDILNSKVPVVVYISPSGARATSAGVFITLASHIAAMAPGTHIGAAHPVAIGGFPSQAPAPEKKTPSDADEDPMKRAAKTMEEKAVSDTRAWAISLAELRGRNADWAALAVTESKSLSSDEAVASNVVDFIAADLNELLGKLDGRSVKLAGGSVTLQTRDAPVRTISLWWGDRLLGAISHPNIAFLLLMFGFYGILFELYTPGWGVAGTLGAFCLVLAFFGLAVLPLNYAGLALIVIAMALFVAEAFVTSFGALTVGGLVCLVLGGLMVVDSPVGFMRVSATVVVPVAVATAAITVFLVSRIVKGLRTPVRTGDQRMSDLTATADEAFHEEQGEYVGTVRVHGELWRAASASPVDAGTTLCIKGRRNLVLEVEPAAKTEQKITGEKGE